MKCIYCDYKDTDVKNSRKNGDNNSVWRRRYCSKCEEVFTTKERLDLSSYYVVKKNLSRQKFVYEKLLISVYNSIDLGKDFDSGDVATISKRVAEDFITNFIKYNKAKYFSTKDIIIYVYKFLNKENNLWATRYALYSEYRIKTLKNFLK